MTHSLNAIQLRALVKLAFMLAFISSVPLRSAAADPSRWEATVDSSNSMVTLSNGAARLEVKVCTPNVIMVNFMETGTASPDTLVLHQRSWAPVTEATFDVTDESVRVGTTKLSLSISRNPLRLVFTDSNGTLLLDDGGSMSSHAIRFVKGTSGPMYGITGQLNQSLTVDGNLGIFAGSNGGAGAPFLWSTNGFGVLWDSDGGGTAIEPNSFAINQPTKVNFKYFLLAGRPREIFRGVGEVSGFPPLVPKYVVGFMNFEWGMIQTELLRHIEGYRSRKIPIDLFGIDYEWFNFGKDNYQEFEWNTRNYPDGPSGKLCKEILPPLGIKLATIRKPWLKMGTQQWRDAAAKGWLHPDGKGGLSREFDMTTQEARDWWWAHSRHLVDTGIPAYWTDEADGINNFRYIQMQEMYYRGERSLSDRRVWSLNRNFYLGSQRYAYTNWSGDIDCTWKSMQEQRGMMLTSLHLGQTWWSMDTGGFRGLPWWLDLTRGLKGLPSPETYVRWIQFGSFAPVFRVHGRHSNHRQPWKFGAKAEAAATKFIRLRYELLPYWYSLAWHATTHNLSPVRSLVFDYPEDPRVANSIDEWMAGDFLLVAPVAEQGAKQVTLYLPQGEWIDYFTGEQQQGGREVVRPVDANWQDIPLYIKRGAILPKAPPVQYVDEKPLDPITVDVYPAPVATELLYFDDDGKSYAYERGEYFTIPFRTQRDPSGAVRFSLGKREGKRSFPFTKLIVRFHLLEKRAVSAVTVDGAPNSKGEAGHQIVDGPDGTIVTVPVAPHEDLEVIVD